MRLRPSHPFFLDASRPKTLVTNPHGHASHRQAETATLLTPRALITWPSSEGSARDPKVSPSPNHFLLRTHQLKRSSAGKHTNDFWNVRHLLLSQCISRSPPANLLSTQRM